MDKMKPLTEADVAIRIEALPEEAPIDGNVCANDCAEACAQRVKDQLNAGNEWAWCTVRVVAEWEGLHGDAYLGCCSYDSESEFTKPGGYFDDMKADAVADLNQFVRSLRRKLCATKES